VAGERIAAGEQCNVLHVRVTIVGGGGFRVPLIADRLAASGLPVRDLALYDTDASRLAVMTAVLAGNAALARGGGQAALPVRATTSMDEALRGADFIFCALRAGGLDGRVRDERRALDLGILGQETVGAGGLASAARAVPVSDQLARRIAELAPRAWVITMTNPAGIVTETMAHVLGNRVIGVCDSPVGLIRRVCAACGVDPGPDLGAVAGRVDAGYLGINHLGWLRSLTVDGTDLLPGLLADPGRLASFEEGRLFGPDIVEALGAIPNEYVYWYYAAQEALRDVRSAGRTRGEHVRQRQRAFYAAASAAATAAATAGPVEAARLWREANDERNRSYFAELRAGAGGGVGIGGDGTRAGERDEADVAAGGYESVAVALAAALAGGPEARLILNVPNGGTLPGLPEDMTVEVPCRVTSAGAVPLDGPPGGPTVHELGLMSAVRSCERDIAAAALAARDGSGAANGDGDGGTGRAERLALRAFARHPLVGSLEASRALAAAALASSSSR
jgi:6-phospho-beta-glucosidase